MVKYENNKLIIEIETDNAAEEHRYLIDRIIDAVGAIDGEKVNTQEEGKDCILALGGLMDALVADEEAFERYVYADEEERKRIFAEKIAAE